jgi:hypothetical protein
MWAQHEPPSSSTHCCSTYITSNSQVTKEQPARDQGLITLTWRLERRIHNMSKSSFPQSPSLSITKLSFIGLKYPVLDFKEEQEFCNESISPV